MAVQARSQNLAYCSWERDGRLHYGTFEVTSLRVASERPQSGAHDDDDSLPCS